MAVKCCLIIWIKHIVILSHKIKYSLSLLYIALILIKFNYTKAYGKYVPFYHLCDVKYFTFLAFQNWFLFFTFLMHKQRGTADCVELKTDTNSILLNWWKLPYCDLSLLWRTDPSRQPFAAPSYSFPYLKGW